MQDETYMYFYGSKLKVVHEFELKEVTWVVAEEDEGYLVVHRKSDLKRWEDTYQYQEELKRKNRLAEIEERQEKIVIGLKDRAIKSLRTRIGLNTLFGGQGSLSSVSGVIMDELQKLIEGDKELK